LHQCTNLSQCLCRRSTFDCQLGQQTKHFLASHARLFSNNQCRTCVLKISRTEFTNLDCLEQFVCDCNAFRQRCVVGVHYRGNDVASSCHIRNSDSREPSKDISECCDVCTSLDDLVRETLING